MSNFQLIKVSSWLTATHLLLTALVLLVAISAFSVVYVKHNSRKLFAELQGLQKVRDDMNIKWDQLQLEQATYATHSRIEQKARKQLGMTLPTPEQLIVIQP